MSSQSTQQIFDPFTSGYTDIISIINKRAELTPDKVIYRFLEDGEHETDLLTFKQLDTKARTVAYYLQQHGKRGDRVLLLFPTGLEYVTAFFGCLYAGMIAIPAYPPRRNRSLNRIHTIISDSGAKTSLLSEKVATDIQHNFANDEVLNSIQWIVYKDFDETLASKWVAKDIRPEEVALLQYTSGSTGEPKGVMITHGNIIYNSETIRRSFSFDENLQGVNWLPIFHDMGLIGTIIQPAYIGGANVIMPPVAFLKNPINWLKAIEKYKANNGGGPNFGYDYLISKTTEEERAKLDLSRVETFYCGAEPIRKSTLEAFTEGLKAAGVSQKQLFPCYGLAEGTLIVTGSHMKELPKYLRVNAEALSQNRIQLERDGNPKHIDLVGCGHVWMETRVAIVDSETHLEVGDDLIGEVWVSGPTVAKGYWNNEEQTRLSFQAHIADSGEGPFLRTGDLGFFHEKELYITGRLKDLIIIRGINYYPSDIEYTVQQVDAALRPYGGAAIPVVAGDEEKLVVVQELERTAMRNADHASLISDIRKAIAEEHELEVFAVLLIRTGSLPLTSSGKIQRRQTKYDYLNGVLDVVASWEAEKPTDAKPSIGKPLPTEAAIKEWLADWIVRNQHFRREDIDADKHLLSYGLDSLAAVTLETEISAYFGVKWHVSSFMLNPTINKIAKEGAEMAAED